MINEIIIPKGATDEQELLARFRIVCRRCGSDDVVANIERSYAYSEYTQGGGSIQIGCNACMRNDWSASP